MSADPSLLRALEVAQSLRDIGAVAVKRFFGGSGLQLGDVQFAFVMKGTLYLRADDSSRSKFERLGALPFSYATRAGRVTVSSYYETPADVMDDPVALRAWAIEAHGSALKARRKPPRRLAASESGPRQLGRHSSS